MCQLHYNWAKIMELFIRTNLMWYFKTPVWTKLEQLQHLCTQTTPECGAQYMYTWPEVQNANEMDTYTVHLPLALIQVCPSLPSPPPPYRLWTQSWLPSAGTPCPPKPFQAALPQVHCTLPRGVEEQALDLRVMHIYGTGNLHNTLQLLKWQWNQHL